MPGLRVTVVNAGPLECDKSLLVALATGVVKIPTTVGIIEHPQHGLILWDTGINDIVADPDRGDEEDHRQKEAEKPGPHLALQQ